MKNKGGGNGENLSMRRFVYLSMVQWAYNCK